MSKASLFICNPGPLAAALCGILAVGLTGCSSEPTTVAPAAEPVALVATAAAPIDPALRATGLVRGRHAHVVTSEAAGRIVGVHADVGAHVRRGQLLATIEGEPLRLQLVVAEAEVARAAAVAAEREAALARTRGLVEAGVASQADYDALAVDADSARKMLEAARASAELSRRAVREAEVRAPLDGVVAARRVELSQAVAAGEALFDIDGPGRRDIVLMAPATATLEPGAHARFWFDGGAGEARLLGVSARAGSAGARTARLEILSDAPLAGTPVEVAFSGSSSPTAAAIVPLAAVLSGRDGARRVLQVDAEGVLQEAAVELLAVTDAGALVSGPTRPGDRVVAAGGEFLAVGTRVRAVAVQR
ncbi:efflux RND transporter periplasmic adaptor subunit [Silanimonas sp.]|uniref:efflux RND transporter periplasmic adaptor subunit n=1 Tax=Silanimonas sp. TaxID=1929290 RepID=UPI0022C00396|nr:efflux RND transporter periplasmic adaptor subunit [Silanimonas sp.]MCZ8063589.1 efflux RND transporter periplasmic adaptor subunit [Silanimonas sp.]